MIIGKNMNKTKLLLIFFFFTVGLSAFDPPKFDFDVYPILPDVWNMQTNLSYVDMRSLGGVDFIRFPIAHFRGNEVMYFAEITPGMIKYYVNGRILDASNPDDVAEYIKMLDFWNLEEKNDYGFESPSEYFTWQFNKNCIPEFVKLFSNSTELQPVIKAFNNQMFFSNKKFMPGFDKILSNSTEEQTMSEAFSLGKSENNTMILSEQITYSNLSNVEVIEPEDINSFCEAFSQKYPDATHAVLPGPMIVSPDYITNPSSITVNKLRLAGFAVTPQTIIDLKNKNIVGYDVNQTLMTYKAILNKSKGIDFTRFPEAYFQGTNQIFFAEVTPSMVEYHKDGKKLDADSQNDVLEFKKMIDFWNLEQRDEYGYSTPSEFFASEYNENLIARYNNNDNFLAIGNSKMKLFSLKEIEEDSFITSKQTTNSKSVNVKVIEPENLNTFCETFSQLYPEATHVILPGSMIVSIESITNSDTETNIKKQGFAGFSLVPKTIIDVKNKRIIGYDLNQTGAYSKFTSRRDVLSKSFGYDGWRLKNYY